MSAIPLILNNITTILKSDNLAGSLNKILMESERRRFEDIQKYWTYYNHNHYAHIDFAESDLPFTPYCTAFIQKVATWMVGTDPKYHSREDIAFIMDELYLEILENSGESMHFEALEMGSVTGDCLLAVQFDPFANEEAGGFVIKVIESDKMLLEYRNVGQKRILSRVLLFWEELDDNGDVVITTELWDSESVTVITTGPSLQPHLTLGRELKRISYPVWNSSLFNTSSDQIVTYENPYRELPFVHIKNLPGARDVLGLSDMSYLMYQNMELDEQILNYKENVDYHSNPILMMYGVKGKDLEKGARRTWAGLPEKAKVEYLHMQDTHESILKYMDMIESSVGISGVSRDILNNKDLNFRDSSYASLRLAFLPLVELIERKTMTYSPGFARAMEKAIRYTNDFFVLGLENLTKPSKRYVERLQDNADALEGVDLERLLALRNHPYYETKVIFQDHLPRNQAVENAAMAADMSAGLEDIDTILRKMGVNDIERKKQLLLETADFRRQYNERMEPPPEEEPPLEEEPINQELDENGVPIPPDSSNLSPAEVEENTGQSAERTQTQRNMRGQGGE